MIFLGSPICGAKSLKPGETSSQGFGVETNVIGVRTSDPIAPVIVYSRRKPEPPEFPFQFCKRYMVEMELSNVIAGTCVPPILPDEMSVCVAATFPYKSAFLKT